MAVNITAFSIKALLFNSYGIPAISGSVEINQIYITFPKNNYSSTLILISLRV